MRILIFLPLLLTSIIASGSKAAAREPVVQAVIDWQNEKILLSAEWLPGQALRSQSNTELRQRMREVLLRKLSIVAGDLWQRSTGHESTLREGPDFSELWSSLRLTTFQIAEDRALATMQLSLRGRDSLLAQLPLDFGKEIIDPPSASASDYDKRAHVGQYDNSEQEPLLYTGLVIDARHLPYIPSLDTGIFTAAGRQIYGAAFLTRNTAVKRGVAAFLPTDTLPAAQRRAGKRPLKISALDVQTAGNYGLVISEEDAAKLTAHAGSLRNLRRARVVIMVNGSSLRENY